MELNHLRLTLNPDQRSATITLDHPEKMNRVSLEARGQLRRLFEQLDAADDVDLIVVRGAGDQAFTAGGDIPAFLTRPPEGLAQLHDDIAAPERCAKPVVAAVSGYCFGVGFELALACDFILASRGSTFALPEVTLGMIPGSGGSQRLLRILGPIRTKWLVLRGARLSAEQAYEWGVISRLVEPGQLDAAVEELAAEVRGLPRVALRTLKRVINAGQNATLQSGMELEGLAYGLLRSTDDFVEGATAFGEKRRPRFGQR